MHESGVNAREKNKVFILPARLNQIKGYAGLAQCIEAVHP